MQNLDDNTLLREYVERDSEEAFATLVARHINKVYSVALRHTGNAHSAEEITQAVFVILARKARQLGKSVVLSGWLYQAARLTSATFIRSEIRRAHREQEAHLQSVLNENESDAWTQISPLLDAAMAALNETDRHAIVLRFFDGKSMKEVGAELGASEDAAKVRVNRAVEKLRRFFSKRSVMVPAGELTAAISANSVQAAPVALAKTTTALALAKGAAASTSTLTLIKGALKVMAWTKAKTAVVVGVIVILTVSTTAVAVKKITTPSVEGYFTHFESVDIDKAPPVLVLRPTRYGNENNVVWGGNDTGEKQKIMRRGTSVPEILATAYGFSPDQMVLPAGLPRDKFDLLLTLPNNSREALRAEIKKQFGLVAHPETRAVDVFVLRDVNPGAPGLKNGSAVGPYISQSQASLKLTGYKISNPDNANLNTVVHVLGAMFNRPVIDETGLTSSYDIDFQWNGNLKGNAQAADFRRVLREQTGLELAPARRSVEMLVVEKVQ